MAYDWEAHHQRQREQVASSTILLDEPDPEAPAKEQTSRFEYEHITTDASLIPSRLYSYMMAKWEVVRIEPTGEERHKERGWVQTYKILLRRAKPGV